MFEHPYRPIGAGGFNALFQVYLVKAKRCYPRLGRLETDVRLELREGRQIGQLLRGVG